MSRPLVSVSGVRGIVDESFTPSLVFQWVSAYAQFLQKQFRTPLLVVGRDTRPSGVWAEQEAIAACNTHGIEPLLLGIVPTPTVGIAVRHHNAHGGLIITGSHNPEEWNALKFLGSDGVFLDEATIRQLEIMTNEMPSRSENTIPLRSRQDTDAINRHVEQILRTLPIEKKTLAAAHLRVVVDPVNGTGALAVPALLTSLGVEYELLHGKPDGLFTHPPEPTPANLVDIGKRVKEMGAHLGIATDPDADRLVLVDETGTVLSEEYTVTLAALSLLSSLPETKRHAPLVVNLSTTRVVDDIAHQFGTTVVRTPVGERHVVEGMRVENALIGGEGNGGVIVAQSHEGRDALAGIALILHLLATKKTTLSALVDSLPHYVMEKEKFPRREIFDMDTLPKKLATQFPNATFTTIDGVRMDTQNGWVHVRASNTEPVIRIIGEANNQENLQKFFQAVHSSLQT